MSQKTSSKSAERGKAKVKKKVIRKLIKKGERVGELVATGGKNEERRRDIDWMKLKSAFFKSNYGSVLAFLREAGIVDVDCTKPPGSISKKVLGWSESKRKLYRDVVEDLREEFREQSRQHVKDFLLPLNEARRYAINLLVERLGMRHEAGAFGRQLLSVGDIISILHELRTEMGEPNNVSLNKNLSANIDLNKLLDYVDKSDDAFDPRSLDRFVYGNDLESSFEGQ